MSHEFVDKLKLQIGEYTLHSIPTGVFGLDGGAMFGTVPKVLWQKAIVPDELNRIPLEARALLLKGKNRNILIDCGNGRDFVEKYGEKVGRKFEQIYSISDEGPSLERSLKKYGIGLDDITDVILTHLHFDHCGGGTCFDSLSHELVPSFRNANYYIQKNNLETAKNPNIREKASYLYPNFSVLEKKGCLRILNGKTENLFPNVSVDISDGHTCGQQVVFVHDEQNTLLYAGDVIPTSAHIRLAWVMGYDLDPLLIIEEKNNFLNLLSQKNGFVFFEHDSQCEVATVARQNDDYLVSKKYFLE